MAGCDRRDAAGSQVGRCLQEEYGEWRTVRNTDGHIFAVELTTELPEYWEVLAAFVPETALHLAARFAGVAMVSPSVLYGNLDPFADVEPESRAAAFRTHALGRGAPNGPASAVNNGSAAICCMIHPDNTLESLGRLMTAAARPYLVTDPITGRSRHASGSEAIVGLDIPATDKRNSDPLLVETVTRLTTRHWTVSACPPVGVYIRDVLLHELVTSDGRDVPPEWVNLSREQNSAPFNDSLPRHQRLRLAAPPDSGFTISDLTVRRTGEPLRYGGQFAELVQLGVYLECYASEPGGDVAASAPPVADSNNCEDIRSVFERFT